MSRTSQGMRRPSVRGSALVLAAAAVLAACTESPTEAPLAVPTAVLVAPDHVSLESIGQTVEFTARVLDAQGRELRDVPLVWSSSDPAILAPVAGATFKSVANGTAVIWARVDPAYLSRFRDAAPASAQVAVTVHQKAVALRLGPESQTLGAIGQRRLLTLELTDQLGNPLQRSITATWSSENGNAVAVSPTGEITALADGESRITALVEGLSGSTVVRVSARLPFTVCFKFSLSAGGATASAPECGTITVTAQARSTS
jgi:uncharacterized protein YjdB